MRERYYCKHDFGKFLPMASRKLILNSDREFLGFHAFSWAIPTSDFWVLTLNSENKNGCNWQDHQVAVHRLGITIEVTFHHPFFIVYITAYSYGCLLLDSGL